MKIRDLLFFASKGSAKMFSDTPTSKNLEKYKIIKDLYDNYLKLNIRYKNTDTILDGSKITLLDLLLCAFKYIDTLPNDDYTRKNKTQLYTLYLLFTGRAYTEDFCE